MTVQKSLLSGSFWRRRAPQGGTPRREDCWFNARAAIAAFPGPAMLLDAGADLLAANGEAARLARALSQGGAQEIRQMIHGMAVTGRPAMGHILLPRDQANGDGQALYYLHALAISPAQAHEQTAQADAGYRQFLVLARDASAEFAMRRALIESRDLYRDLSRCSSDFAWQTDENGAFTFVSAKGALGYSANALNGRISASLIVQNQSQPQGNPFGSRDAVENVEIALRAANGETRYCLVHAVPVFGQENNWRGARGAASDITQTRQHQIVLDYIREREDQVRKVVDATHGRLDTATAFCEAAAIMAGDSGALHCMILAFSNQQWSMLGESGPDDAGAIPERIYMELRAAPAYADGPAEAHDFTYNNQRHQFYFTAHAGTANGAIWLRYPADWKPRLAPPFTPPDIAARPLAQAVSSQIGIAIAHAMQMQRLAEISRTDELTGLLNRRAFMDDLQHRHAHQFRSGRKGALLYIDLDNFKQINDSFGHDAGDLVLREVAGILRNHSRIGDICARLGGDEFAIWLEATDEEGAVRKCNLLLSDTHHLQSLAPLEHANKKDVPGLSIGIAISDPGSPMSLAQLMKRADEAMYEVKHQGKGGLWLAAGVMQAQTDSCVRS